MLYSILYSFILPVGWLPLTWQFFQFQEDQTQDKDKDERFPIQCSPQLVFVLHCRQCLCCSNYGINYFITSVLSWFRYNKRNEKNKKIFCVTHVFSLKLEVLVIGAMHGLLYTHNSAVQTPGFSPPAPAKKSPAPASGKITPARQKISSPGKFVKIRNWMEI